MTRSSAARLSRRGAASPVAPKDSALEILAAILHRGGAESMTTRPADWRAWAAANWAARVVRASHHGDQAPAGMEALRTQLGLRANFASLHALPQLDGCALDLGAPFLGRPVVVVGAGPSLAEHAHLLPDLARVAAIVVVNTALPLAARHVTPDVVVALDQFDHSAHFAGASRIPLGVMGFSSHPRVRTAMRETCSAVTWVSCEDPLGSTLPQLVHGNSAVTCAVALAGRWGAREIVLLGVDLAFAGERDYADGAGARVPLPHERGIAPGWAGPVESRRDWVKQRDPLERHAYEAPWRRHVTTSPHGLRLDGWELASVVDWLSSATPIERPTFTPSARDWRATCRAALIDEAARAAMALQIADMLRRGKRVSPDVILNSVGGVATLLVSHDSRPLAVSLEHAARKVLSWCSSEAAVLASIEALAE